MRLQRGAVIDALVAEQDAIRLQQVRVPHQPIPVVMARFVAEMAENGAVGLVHLLAHAFAFDGVGLGDVDGDDTTRMAGQDPLRKARPVGEEIEGEAPRITRLRCDREVESQSRIDEAALFPPPAASTAGDDPDWRDWG